MEAQVRLLQLKEQRLRLYRVFATEPYAESVRKRSAARVWQDPGLQLRLARSVAQGWLAAPDCSCERCMAIFENEQDAKQRLARQGSTALDRLDVRRVRKALVHELAYCPLLANSWRREGAPTWSLEQRETLCRGPDKRARESASTRRNESTSAGDTRSPSLSGSESTTSMAVDAEIEDGGQEQFPGREPPWAVQLMELQQVWEVATTPVPLHEAFAAATPSRDTLHVPDSDADDSEDHQNPVNQDESPSR
ncbi:hypothetical protein CYME_CMH265C [Cyanidioschyzon merolae strain 10D]|uniref:Uncharacterized protein n=1 Tax=Cyanidioschyzon merolae (strain NIES-3377 / 10D) TaxID=280699 RepID=M1V7M6_CYAM1|nr:hypothetical protein CYME_CMH265C [Cyanidioschyzon merolae strain 10D]BAM79909.1 hypothetical protein CYME_CMH265C [Cyanidioschyzon merolae strain 10D]|eukprot:XP_005536195.1 hypothetical protein CYME_CMH265C [Cyanidioschyzon merolae strain 10D]